MQFPQVKIPSINKSFIQTVPSYFRIPQISLGKTLSLPRLEANILMRQRHNNKPIMDMVGNLKVKKFSFKKSIQYAKEAPYAR